MALIVCSECGKEYSDKAISCPQCGCPTPRECVEGGDGSVTKEAKQGVLHVTVDDFRINSLSPISVFINNQEVAKFTESGTKDIPISSDCEVVFQSSTLGMKAYVKTLHVKANETRNISISFETFGLSLYETRNNGGNVETKELEGSSSEMGPVLKVLWGVVALVFLFVLCTWCGGGGGYPADFYYADAIKHQYHVTLNENGTAHIVLLSKSQNGDYIDELAWGRAREGLNGVWTQHSIKLGNQWDDYIEVSVESTHLYIYKGYVYLDLGSLKCLDTRNAFKIESR